MYFYQQIADGLVRIGVNDRRTARFENMFPIPHGVSYNAYLIQGEKTVLMDTVDTCFMHQFLQNLEAALSGRPLDYLVISHMEPDHSSAIKAVLRDHPECKLVGNAKSFKLMEQFFGDAFADRQHLVKDGEELDIGGRKLKFLFAPMVHWPEVMVTLTDRGELFTADAFGSFGAIEGHIYSDTFDWDERFMEEARRYYVNIVGKHGRSVSALLSKLDPDAVHMILPLHGPIHRKRERIEVMLQKYATWASFSPEEPGVVIVYASMYGNTELAADILATHLVEEGVERVRMFDVSEMHYSYIISEAHRFSHLVFTPLTYNAELYPNLDAFLRDLVSTGYKNRSYAMIANQSWGGKAVAIAEEILSKANMTKVSEDILLQSSATNEDLEALRRMAKDLAQSVREQNVHKQ